MQSQSVSAYLGEQISPEQGRQLDALQTQFQVLVTKVDANCDEVPPAVATSILYHFCGFGFSFFRLANQRSTSTIESMISAASTETPSTVTPPAVTPLAVPPAPVAPMELVAMPEIPPSNNQALPN